MWYQAFHYPSNSIPIQKFSECPYLLFFRRSNRAIQWTTPNVLEMLKHSKDVADILKQCIKAVYTNFQFQMST